MSSLSNRSQLLIALALVALLALTRGQHFAALHSLPGASWAVFFLAGVYLRPRWVLPALLAFTWLLDFTAFAWGNAGRFCLTPAYVFLLPAYAALWGAGRWYAARHRFAWSTLIPLIASVFTGAAVCEILSSGGFYYFSGRFAEPTLAEFGSRLAKYFPGYLESLLFYVAIAAIVQVAIMLVVRNAARIAVPGR